MCKTVDGARAVPQIREPIESVLMKARVSVGGDRHGDREIEHPERVHDADGHAGSEGAHRHDSGLPPSGGAAWLERTAEQRVQEVRRGPWLTVRHAGREVVQMAQVSQSLERFGDYLAHREPCRRVEAEPIQAAGEKVELFRTDEHRSLLGKSALEWRLRAPS
jgi:hypothetical protein